MTTTPTREGLALYVARTAGLGDCTAGGITATHDRLTLVGVAADDGTVRPMTPDARIRAVTPDAPAVALRVTIVGTPSVHVVPVESSPDGGYRVARGAWYMAGGNYASSSDARVGELLESLLGHRFYGALSVHDRRES
jgi:hypothetical protein